MKLTLWKSKYYLCFMLVLALSAAACGQERNDYGPSIVAQQRSQEDLPDQVKNVTYQKDGIEASYPELVSGKNDEDVKKWNDLISADFNEILDLYSFRPFPEPTPSPSAVIPTILKLSYEMKLNNNRYTSILYTAAFNSPYSAHPSGLVYTTNIDKEKNSRLKLSDLIKLDQDFVKDFRTWDFIGSEENPRAYNQAIRDYIANLSDKDLLMGFAAADKIGSGNLYDIYSYLTPDRLGISIGVPNYIGDHVEYEKEYSKIKDFLVPEFEAPGVK